MVKKKGQAAMEFLMTYGWAILVVLAAIGALAYFGVLSPKNLLPSSCTVGAGFGCSDAKATSNTFELTLRNNMGEDINNGMGISFGGDTLTCRGIQKVTGTTYTWTANTTADNASTGSNCGSVGYCSYVVAGGPIKNGKDIGHIVFDECGFSGTSSLEFVINYTKAGESVSHQVQGKANLKVEG
ncbi:MAG: hypothetical protein ABIJ21_05535 [Nanoarchaeota archaeon]